MFSRLLNLYSFVSLCLWQGRKNNTKLLLAMFVDVLNSVIKVGGAILIGREVISLSSGNDSLAVNGFIIAVAAVMAISINILPIARGYLLSSVRSNTQSSILERLLRKTYGMKLDEHIAAPTGRFPQLLTAVYSNVEKVIPTLHGELFPALVDLVAIIAGLFYINLYCGLAAIFGLILYCVSSSYNAAKMGEASKQRLSASYGAYGGLLASIARYKVAHQFGNVEYEVKKVREVLDVQKSAFMGVHRQDVFSGLRNNIIAIVTIVVVAGLAVYGFLFAGLSMLEAMLVGYLASILSSPLRSLGKALEQVYVDSIECEKIIDFTTSDSGLEQSNNAQELKLSGAPSIEFKNINFSYGSNKEQKTLDNVSFEVRAGQTVAIVGESGSGKSTLVNLLLRFYAQDSGDVIVNGKDTRTVTSESLRSHISVVSQNPDLFQGSIAENIAYADWSADTAKINQAAKDGGLDAWLDSNERNLDEQLGGSGDSISGGQKQRVALARALLKDGEIFLLDEATSALDISTEKEIMTRVDALTEGKTVIVVTHRITNIVNVDWIVYLQEGVVKEQGTFIELLQIKGAFYQQLKVECDKLGIDINELAVGNEPVNKIEEAVLEI